MKIAHIKFYVNILDIKLICDYSLFVNRDPFDNVRDQWGQQRPDLDPSGFEIFWRIFFLNKDLRRSAGRRLSRLELPNWAFDVLAILRRQGPPFQMSPSVLCKSVMLSSGAMTNRLDRLQAAGFIERQADPNDRRGLIVQLTERGRAVTDEAVKIRFDHANQALNPLSQSERLQLTNLLRKLVLARVEE